MNARFSRRSLKISTIILLIVLSILTLFRSDLGFIYGFSFNSIVELYPLSDIPLCISNNLSEKPLNISLELHSWDELQNMSWSKHVINGHWRPTYCNKNESLAIIIPFRDREAHLKIFLNHLHPFLQRQMAEYRIFVIEQSEDGIFNKGSLANVGFKIANIVSKNVSCFIFHDVDMLPIKDHNIYQCLNYPLHLGAAVDKFEYKLLYDSIVGGVLAMSYEQFTNVNGFSNFYEGWGGEDDEMAYRIKEENYKIMRYPIDIGQYQMIKHARDKGNPINDERIKLLSSTKSRYKWDGINNLLFEITKVNNHKSNLFYWITVQLPQRINSTLKNL